MNDPLNCRHSLAGTTRFLSFALLAAAAAVSAQITPRAAPEAIVRPLAPAPLNTNEASAEATQTTHPLDARDLESWLDGVLPAALEQREVAGAVVSVVKHGHVLLSKGYGYADVGAKVAMDPRRSLVRPGSTSKLFIWTAMM